MMSVTSKTSYSVCRQMHYKDLCSSVSKGSSKFFYFNETSILLISLLLDFQNTIPQSRLLKPNSLYSFQIRKRRNLSTFIMWCLFFKLRGYVKNDTLSAQVPFHTLLLIIKTLELHQPTLLFSESAEHITAWAELQDYLFPFPVDCQDLRVDVLWHGNG